MQMDWYMLWNDTRTEWYKDSIVHTSMYCIHLFHYQWPPVCFSHFFPFGSHLSTLSGKITWYKWYQVCISGYRNQNQTHEVNHSLDALGRHPYSTIFSIGGAPLVRTNSGELHIQQNGSNTDIHQWLKISYHPVPRTLMVHDVSWRLPCQLQPQPWWHPPKCAANNRHHLVNNGKALRLCGRCFENWIDMNGPKPIHWTIGSYDCQQIHHPSRSPTNNNTSSFHYSRNKLPWITWPTQIHPSKSLGLLVSARWSVLSFGTWSNNTTLWTNPNDKGTLWTKNIKTSQMICMYVCIKR